MQAKAYNKCHGYSSIIPLTTKKGKILLELTFYFYSVYYYR